VPDEPDPEPARARAPPRPSHGRPPGLLRRLVAQLDVVLPSTTPSRRSADRPGARHPRTVPHGPALRPPLPGRSAARPHAGARGFALDDATGVRDSAAALALQWQGGRPRALTSSHTLVGQLERLTTAIDEVDRAATTLLPPSDPAPGLRGRVAANHPGSARRRPPRCSENSARSHASPMRGRSVAYVGFYPVINQSGDRAATPRLSRASLPPLRAIRSYLAASMPCAVVASGAPFISQGRPRAKRAASAGRGRRQAACMRCTLCSNTGTLQPLTSARSLGRRFGT